ncbi:MAG: hypothetical protein PHF84_00075 [bacterium]|nr:hypothetical protein [bacterium]
MNIVYYDIFLLGFYSLVTQVFFIKEILSTFSSNEITAGLILAFWLLGNGLGNFLSRRYHDKLKERVHSLFFLNLNLFFIGLILVRFFCVFFHIPLGEMVNVFYLFLFSLVVVVPFSLLWGINFNYLYIMIKEGLQPESRMYSLEALGAALASLLTSYVFIRLNSVFLIAGILYFLLMISFVLNRKIKHPLFVMTGVIFILLLLFHQKIDYFTEIKRYKNLTIEKSLETPYGRLVVARYRNTFSFYNNNLFLFSLGDRVLPELMVSLLASEVERMDRVLVINNGMDGIVEKLLSDPEIKNLYYVESNPYLMNLYMNYARSDFLKDPRLEVFIQDGRGFLNRVHGKFDAVLVHTPDPYDLQLNRYFSREFFVKVRNVLTKRGVLLFKASSSENFLNPYQSRYLGSLYNTLKEVFPDILLFPGDPCFILASPAKGVLTYDENELRKRGEALHSDYYKAYFLPSRCNEFKLHQFLNSIDQSSGVNRDLKPITFFYHMVLWTTRTSQSIKDIFSFFYHVPFIWFILLLISGSLVFYFFMMKEKAQAIMLSMSVTGFTVIGLEILSLFLYQILRGNLYFNMGLLFFSYMLGLSAGSLIYPRIRWSRIRIFKSIQFLFIFIPCLIFPLYYLLNLLASGWIMDMVFILFILLFSTLSGIQFPASVQLHPDSIFSPSRINSIDLFSSAAGAFLVSLFFIPLYGITNTALFLSLTNLIAFLIIIDKLRW